MVPSSFHRSAHHKLTLRETLQWYGNEHPSFVAALLGYLRALSRQLPVLGGAQLGGNNLGIGEET